MKVLRRRAHAPGDYAAAGSRGSGLQKLEQLINLAVHTAAFAAFNSGLWVWHGLKPSFFPQLPWLTGLWAVALAVHVVWVLVRRR